MVRYTPSFEGFARATGVASGQSRALRGPANFGAANFGAMGEKSCSVEEIERAGGDTWRAFCDCVFTTPQKAPIWTYNGNPIPVAAGVDPLLIVEQLKQTPGFNADLLVLRMVDSQVRDADWSKCAANSCLVPTGCYNYEAKQWDNFNAHPGMLFAPWTELGAGARGIPKKDAGFWYGLAGATSVSIADFHPLKLWVYKWTNPIKFSFLAGLASIFGAAPLFAIPGALELAAVAAAPISEAAEPGFLLKNLVRPLARYGMAAIGAFLGFMSGGAPAAIAVVIKYQAQEILDQGRVTVDKGPVFGIINALAARGDELRDLFDPATWKRASTWRLLGTLILEISKVFEGVVKDAIGTVGFALQTVAATIQNWQEKGFAEAADLLCADLLGFRLSQWQAARKMGAVATVNLLAVSRDKFNAPGLSAFRNISGAMGAVLDAFVHFGDALAFLKTIGLDLIASLTDAARILRDMLQAINATVDAATAFEKEQTNPSTVVPSPAPVSSPPVAPSPPVMTLASRQNLVLAASMSNTTRSVSTSKGGSGGGAGLLLAGAAALFLF